MTATIQLPLLASLLKDASRVSMLWSLLDGRLLTAKELAYGAGISPQTASFHLRKMEDAGLIESVLDGRHRYVKLASADVAVTLRTLFHLAPTQAAKPAASKANSICFARTCYGHLAGRLGVAVAKSLENKQLIVRGEQRDFFLTGTGEHFFTDFGIDLGALRKSRRLFARQCLDWSERHPHIGGALGVALTDALLRRKWVSKRGHGRELGLTDLSCAGFQDAFGFDTEELAREFF